MRFLLEENHYVDDRLLEKGNEVGDGDASIHPWRYNVDIPAQNIKAGQFRPVSRSMNPLDAEARKAVLDAFGTHAPDRDPTRGIPLQGTNDKAKTPPTIKPPTFQPGAPQVAKHDSAKNPGDAKDTQTAKTPDVNQIKKG